MLFSNSYFFLFLLACTVSVSYEVHNVACIMYTTGTYYFISHHAMPRTITRYKLQEAVAIVAIAPIVQREFALVVKNATSTQRGSKLFQVRANYSTGLPKDVAD